MKESSATTRPAPATNHSEGIASAEPPVFGNRGSGVGTTRAAGGTFVGGASMVKIEIWSSLFRGLSVLDVVVSAATLIIGLGIELMRAWMLNTTSSLGFKSPRLRATTPLA